MNISIQGSRDKNTKITHTQTNNKWNQMKESKTDKQY